MRPIDGEVLHFSEDPTIAEFVPHVAATSSEADPYVWAVDAVRAPDYWFPRQCPRAMAWATDSSTRDDVDRLLGAGGTRVHMIEYGWLDALRSVELYAYRFDAIQFTPIGAERHAYVSARAIRPLGPPIRVRDLVELHDEAGIELRVVSNVWPWWSEVIGSTLGFSGIRLRNARPAGSAG
ncbi:hypothetical protein G1H11_19365 [Phytoactinopolyspora alkaliphila]|uniref:Uncharacterized protein n=1 Tax=Phytoactinopolyspora alkaliphila TaxID=1783498 RepID=A0A6N9YQX4_9ACTN|nr:DUF6886 family protein [Phytoactinopolyspora alkaliphila]NED97461.1 hypothetical protein [Phytoactinopolyspora alkaliphila]